MNRSDWIVVGVRLFGLWLAVEALLALPDLIVLVSSDPPRRLGGQIVKLGLEFVLGSLLCAGAPRFVRWLERKDSRA